MANWELQGANLSPKGAQADQSESLFAFGASVSLRGGILLSLVWVKLEKMLLPENLSLAACFL